MEVQFLGETRTKFDGTEEHSKVLYTAPIAEVVINDVFDAPSTVTASFIMAPGLAMDLFAPSETPGASPSEGGRALYIAVRNRAGRMQTFIITDSEIIPNENGLNEVTVIGADPRIWLQNSPSIHGETGGLYTGTLTEQIQRLTAAYTHISWPGKREWQKKPVMPYDPNWLPNAEQRVRGFIQGSTLETGNALQLETPFPQPVWEAIQALGPAFHEDYTLFPMEIYDAPSQPMWQWVLRERVQTQDVLSDISGTLKTEKISMSNLGAETQNYRSDSNTTVAYSSGNSQVLGEPGYRGAWAMMDFNSVQVPDESPKSFVPAPVVRRRLGITGKAGLSHYVEPGSFARIRIDDRVVPVYLNEVFSYFGSRDWSLGAVYTQVKYWPGANVPDYSPEETVLRLAATSRTTLKVPFNQAPCPQGGVKVTLMKADGTILAQKTFFGISGSSTFTNVISFTNPNPGAEWALRIRYSLGGDSTAFGKAVFGRSNVFDGSLYSDPDSIFPLLKEVIQIPLQGYLRISESAGMNLEFYSQSLLEGSTALTACPINFGGWNENAEVSGLLYARLGAYKSSSEASLRPPFYRTLANCPALTAIPTMPSWSGIRALSAGYMTEFMANSATGNPQTAVPAATFNQDFSKVTEIVRPNSSLSEGFMRRAFAGVRNLSYFLTMTCYHNFQALSSGENRCYEEAFLGATFFSNNTRSFLINVKSRSIGDNFFKNAFQGNNGTFTAALVNVDIPETLEIGDSFLENFIGASNSIALPTLARTFNLRENSRLTKVGDNFMHGSLSYMNRVTVNCTATLSDFSSLTETGDDFLREVVGSNNVLFKRPIAPILKKVGNGFMKNSFPGVGPLHLTTYSLILPSLEEAGNDFLYGANLGAAARDPSTLPTFELSFPNLRTLGDYAFYRAFGGSNTFFSRVDLTNLENAGDYFMSEFYSSFTQALNVWPIMENSPNLGNSAFESFNTASPGSNITGNLTIDSPDFTIGKVGKNFMRRAFYGKTRSRITPFVEPDWEGLEADSEGFMEDLYYDASSLQGNLEVISTNRYNWFNPDAGGEALTGSQRWAKASTIPSGSIVKYTEGTPVGIPSSGTTEEGIPANFLSS